MSTFSSRWLEGWSYSVPVPYFAHVRHLTIHNVEKHWATFGFKHARVLELQRFSWVKLRYNQRDNAYVLEAKTNEPPSVDLSIIKEVNRSRSQAWQNVIPAGSITDREALFLTENTTAVKLGPDFHFLPNRRRSRALSGHLVRKACRGITADLQQRYPGCLTGFSE
eukprot:Skav204091  [mRNA]  locus=scaffold3129:400456:400953:+ [translate_table: standard]